MFVSRLIVNEIDIGTVGMFVVVIKEIIIFQLCFWLQNFFLEESEGSVQEKRQYGESRRATILSAAKKAN